MTYNGKAVVATRPGSMIGAPGQTSYVNVSSSLLAAPGGAGTRCHYSYVIGDTVYVLQGNYTGSGGLNVFHAPTYDPTNLIKTGNVALYRASTHANGTLLEVGDYIYMFGTDGEPTAIYRAPLTSPESWHNTGATLPFSAGGVSVPMAIIGSTIYAFGDGSNGSGDENKIYTAPLSTPTVFSYSGFDIPDGRSGSGLAVTPTTIFLYGGNIGGIEDDGIFSASIADPLTWIDTGSDLPNTYNSVNVYVNDNYVYLLGGRTSSLVDTCYRSPIADGITFSAVQSLAATSTLHSIQEINGRVYLYGGETGSALLLQEASVADLDDNVASPWTATSRSLPDGRWGYAAMAIDDTYYIYGGYNVASGLPTAGTVQNCSLHGVVEDGLGITTRSPTNFNAATVALTTPVAGWNCVRIDDTIWFFGGSTGGSATMTSQVFSAPVSSPTTVTEASASGGFQGSNGKVFIYNGYIYTIGGDDNGNVIGNGVSKAPITDPTEWVTTGNTVPTTLSRYNLAVIGNYVYLFGGAPTIAAGIPGASSTIVYRSLLTELDATGNGNWITATALPTATQDAVMVISNGYLYLIGGCSAGFTSIGTIQACLISELAGGISNFKALGKFSPSGTTIAGAQAVYSDGDFYILGGHTSTTVAAVATIHRTAHQALLKPMDDVREGHEAVPAISLGSGNINSYNTFMQSGNFPWLVAKTT